MKAVITILLIASFCFCPQLNAEQSSWQLKENLEGIPVYTRMVAGSEILEYKADVIVNASISKVLPLFEDEKQIHRWYFQCVLSKLVEHDGPKNEIIYLILHMPWPLSSRDFVFRRTKSIDKDGVISYTLTALPDRLPLVKGMVRVQSISSVWSFKSLPNDRTEVSFQQHTDPAGNIPASLINKLVANTPFFSLKSFRRLVTGTDARS